MALSRSQQKKCKHDWQERPWGAYKADWRYECSKCGGKSRNAIAGNLEDLVITSYHMDFERGKLTIFQTPLVEKAE